MLLVLVPSITLGRADTAFSVPLTFPFNDAQARETQAEIGVGSLSIQVQVR